MTNSLCPERTSFSQIVKYNIYHASFYSKGTLK